ncbi:MAG: hypothetical protein ACFFCM_15815 [Promethearchaeota archaeon]
MASTQIKNKKLPTKWNPTLSTTEKISFLKNHYNGSLSDVSFWDLYKFVKELNS